jgi:hypothetical protein
MKTLKRAVLIPALMIFFGVIVLALVLPSFVEGTITQQKYDVPTTVSICAPFLLGDPTGQISFSPAKKILFSVVPSEYCVLGACSIEASRLNVTGPVNRTIDLGSGFTIPLVSGCITKSTTITGLVAGNYNVQLLVVENGSQKIITNTTLVVN